MSSTGNNITIIERHLDPMQSRFDHLLTPVGLDVKRWRETLFIACEKNPRLLDFPVQQHMQIAMTSATLGLEPDGVLGQLFMIPFGGKSPCIQPVIGYKGMATMAARAGIAISGDVIREGDEFDPTAVAGSPFKVRMKFGHRQQAKIVGAWAQAQLPNGAFLRPVLMDLSELLAIKQKSPGAKKSDSPWNDAGGPGFAAMCAKTAKRRLQRDLPAILTRGLESMNISQHALGSGMETLHEEVGHHTYIDQQATVVDAGTIAEDRPEPGAPEFVIVQPQGDPITCVSITEWRDRFLGGIRKAAHPNPITGAVKRNEKTMDALWRAGFEREVMEVKTAAEERISELSG